MLNRLSGRSLVLRVGLGTGFIAGGLTSLLTGWNGVALVVAAVTGVAAAAYANKEFNK
jgi:hypothetical protein